MGTTLAWSILGGCQANMNPTICLNAFLLLWRGFCIEIEGGVGVGRIIVDEIAHNHSLESIHFHIAEMAMLNVGEIGGVAAAVRGMSIRTTRTRVSRTRAFGEVDPMYLEIGNALRHFLGLI